MSEFGFTFSNKSKKRQRLAQNRSKGRIHEILFALGERTKGNIVKRTGRGHDFKIVDPGNLITGKGKKITYAEVKSSPTAPLSKLQKKTKKEKKGKYKIVRPSIYFKSK